MTTKWTPPFWVGEQMFTQEDLDLIRWTVEQYATLSRTELAYTICENLEWKAPNKKERLHSCLGLLEKLGADGILKLPQKRKLAPYRKESSSAEPLPLRDIQCPLSALKPVMVELVSPQEQSL